MAGFKDKLSGLTDKVKEKAPMDSIKGATSKVKDTLQVDKTKQQFKEMAINIKDHASEDLPGMVEDIAKAKMCGGSGMDVIQGHMTGWVDKEKDRLCSEAMQELEQNLDADETLNEEQSEMAKQIGASLMQGFRSRSRS